jgi:hypothetical protein
MTGEILQFEKSFMPKDFTINGMDFSKRVGDVVIRTRLINVHNGAVLADVIGSGNADENVLETISAALENRLSIGFLQATNISILQILREFKSADIKISRVHSPHHIHPERNIVETASYVIVKTEGNHIYINAGRNVGVSIADLFVILKDDGTDNVKPVAIYSVSMVETNYSRLVLVEPKEAPGTVKVGAKVQRKTRGAALKLEAPKDEKPVIQKEKAKKPKVQKNKIQDLNRERGISYGYCSSEIYV